MPFGGRSPLGLRELKQRNNPPYPARCGRSPLGLRELKLHHGKGDEATLLVAARLGCVN